jgi:flagellar biosynthesis/type III secretory pathway chaperone
MSAKKLIDTLEKLLTLHQSLLKLAEQKTDILKKGDMEGLNALLTNEQKHITAIQQVEEIRNEAVEALLQGQDVDKTISNCIEFTNEPERTKLTQLKDHLTEVITELKERNQLNQQLIHQSLQFVHLTLDMLAPQPASINYGPPQQNATPKRQSMFDSKA